MPTPFPVQTMTVPDLLDTAFRLYRRHFWRYLAVTATVLVPITVLELASVQRYGNHYIITILQTLLVLKLLAGGLVHQTQCFLSLQPFSLGDVLAMSLRRAWPLVQAMVIELVITILPALLVLSAFAVGVTVLAPRLTNMLASTFGPLILVIIWGILSARLVAVNQIIILEQASALDAMRRSWRLMATQWRRASMLFALTTLLGVLVQLPQLLLYISANVSWASGYQVLSSGLFQKDVRTILSQVALMLVFPLQTIVYVLFYYDVCSRVEGYDLEEMVQQVAV